MSTRERTHWVAYFERQHRAQERASQQAEDKQKAAKFARNLRSLRGGAE